MNIATGLLPLAVMRYSPLQTSSAVNTFPEKVKLAASGAYKVTTGSGDYCGGRPVAGSSKLTGKGRFASAKNGSLEIETQGIDEV